MPLYPPRKSLEKQIKDKDVSKSEQIFTDLLSKKLNEIFSEEVEIVRDFRMPNSEKMETPYSYDIFIEKYKTIVEFDGSAFHSSEFKKERDKVKNYIATKCGFIVKRVYYHIPKELITGKKYYRTKKFQSWQEKWMEEATDEVVLELLQFQLEKLKEKSK